MKRTCVALVLLLGSCGQEGPAVSATAVALTEGSITVASPRLIVGEVALQIANVGEFSHTLVVTDDAGVVVAASGLIAPGVTSTMDVLLLPGGYQFSCRIVSSGPDGAVFDHYQLGMRAHVAAEEG